MGADAPFKFGGADGRPHRYPNTWTREKTSVGERLVLAPASGHVDLMIALAPILEAPLGVLWVLVVPRVLPLDSHEPGRYQSRETLSLEGALSFLDSFRDFIEHDGRHHLWLMSASGGGQIVYDNHNMLYFYGDLDWASEVVQRRGLEEGEIPRYPVPHTHRFNEEFDADEARMMGLWEWTRFPLVEKHDDP